jgi:hypothetical protein
MSRPHVIFASVNRRFVAYAELLLKTLRRTNPDHPEVHFYHTDLDAHARGRLERAGRVKTVACTFDDFEAGPAMATHQQNFADPRISYARFLIWTPRFDAYETVLHLDTDLLILGSIRELFETQDFLIYPEAYEGEDAVFYDPRDPALVYRLAEDGIENLSKAANAGVFAVPRSFRTPENYELLGNLIDRYGMFIKWSDQSILNLWMARRGIQVTDDVRFNFQHRLLTRAAPRVLRSARIIHLNGVDLRYRLFLMRAGAALCRVPGGRSVYRMLARTCRALLAIWQQRQRRPRNGQ